MYATCMSVHILHHACVSVVCLSACLPASLPTCRLSVYTHSQPYIQSTQAQRVATDQRQEMRDVAHLRWDDAHAETPPSLAVIL